MVDLEDGRDRAGQAGAGRTRAAPRRGHRPDLPAFRPARRDPRQDPAAEAGDPPDPGRIPRIVREPAGRRRRRVHAARHRLESARLRRLARPRARRRSVATPAPTCRGGLPPDPDPTAASSTKEANEDDEDTEEDLRPQGELDVIVALRLLLSLLRGLLRRELVGAELEIRSVRLGVGSTDAR